MGDNAERDGAPSVRVELLDAPAAVPGSASSPDGPPDDRPHVILALGLLALAFAAIVGALRPDAGVDAASAPLTTTSVAPSTTVAALAPTTAEAVTTTSRPLSQRRTREPIRDVVAHDGGWFALRGFNRPALVFSADGVEWTEVDGPRSDGTIRTIGAFGGELLAVLGTVEVDTSTTRHDVWVRNVSGEWERSAAYEPITGLDGQAWADLAGGTVTTFALPRAAEPAPGLTDLLAEFVADEVAGAACELRSAGANTLHVYDCAGELIGSVEGLERVERQRLQVIASMYENRFELHVAVPLRGVQRVELPEDRVLFGLAPAAGAVVGLVVDPLASVGDDGTLSGADGFELFVTDAFAQFSSVTPVTGAGAEPPVLMSGPDGVVFVSDRLGVRRAEWPYAEFEPYLESPSGGSFVWIDQAGTSLWARTGFESVQVAPLGEGWRTVELDDARGGIEDVLLVNDDTVVLQVDGVPTAVPLPPAEVAP